MVTLAGPSELAPGASGMYTLTITGGAASVAGLDVALAAGGSLAAGPGTKVLNGEVTHSSPQQFSGGSASFTFTVDAPATAATLTLYAAGNSANGNGNESGDKAAATQMSIQVSAGGAGGGAAGGSAGGGSGAGGSSSGTGGGATGSGPAGGGASSPALGGGGPVADAPGSTLVPSTEDPLVVGEVGCASSAPTPQLLCVALVMLVRARRRHQATGRAVVRLSSRGR
jgi:hypothetical protein